MASGTSDEQTLQVSAEAGPEVDNTTGESQLITQDWGLNTLLLEISKNITSDELEEMKFLCRGEDDGIGKRTLEKIKKPLQLFNALRDRRLLDGNNLLHLQGLIWHTSKENHTKLVKYARKSSKRPLHFFVAPKPVNGFTNVTFHIAGSNVDRKQKDDIIATVADIVRTERKYVIWAGATPFESILLVFMIPARVADILLDITPEERCHLAKLDVDKFTVNNRDVIVKGGKCESPKRLSEMDELSRLLREREQYKEQVENMQIRLFQLEEENTAMTQNVEADNLRKLKEEQEMQLLPLQNKLKTMEDQNKQLQPLRSKVTNLEDKVQKQSMALDKYSATLDQSYNSASFTIAALINMILTSNGHGRERLSRKSSLVYFRYCLSKANEEFPDKMDFIHEIVDIASVVAITSDEDKWKRSIEALQLHNFYLHSQIYDLLLLLQIQRTCDSPLSLKSTFLSRPRLHESRPSLKASHIQMGISVTENLMQEGPYNVALQKISELLTDQQKDHLKSVFKLNQADENFTKKHPFLFMDILLGKESTSDSCHVFDIEPKVTKMLSILKDTELQKKAKQLLQSAATEHEKLRKEALQQTNFGKIRTQLPIPNYIS